MENFTYFVISTVELNQDIRREWIQWCRESNGKYMIGYRPTEDGFGEYFTLAMADTDALINERKAEIQSYVEGLHLDPTDDVDAAYASYAASFMEFPTILTQRFVKYEVFKKKFSVNN